MILLVDFGSTFTKVTAIDLDKEIITGTAKSPTTIKTGIKEGLDNAINLLSKKTEKPLLFDEKLACSSAAGGLKMIGIGLVPHLTTKAANLAALKAGAKVIGLYFYKLTLEKVKRIENQLPDIILLAGGTDGGNEEIIIHNAKMLSRLSLDIPIIAAGNQNIQHEIAQILANSKKTVFLASNVMPKLNQLNIEPARNIIREVFIKKIIKAKGLDEVKKSVDNIVMPTPEAVLEGSLALSKGTENEPGIGELLVIDIGGATTDVHSISEGTSDNPKTILKGLKEPYAKRSVEGDLGIRYNASNLVEILPKKEYEKLNQIIDIKKWTNKLSEKTNTIPNSKEEEIFDSILAQQAVYTAVERHSGVRKESLTPLGKQYFQWGKDLSNIEYVIGTGGPLINCNNSLKILEGCLFDPKKSQFLKPRNPTFLLDKEYILSSIGLLSSKYPDSAIRIMKKYLKKLSN